MIQTRKIIHQPVSAFETMRTYDGQIRAFKQHLLRLIQSYEIIRDNLGMTKASISTITKEHLLSLLTNKCLERLEKTTSCADQAHSTDYPKEWVVRCYLSLDLKISVVVQQIDFSYVGSTRILKSIHDPLKYSPEAKHTDRQSWQTLIDHLGCDELLLCDPFGHPLESSHSNLWRLERLCSEKQLRSQLEIGKGDVMKGLTWITPETNGTCLPGITRSILINILRSYGADVIESKLPIVGTNETERSSYYLSSTLKSLAWVKQIDHHRFTKPKVNTTLLKWVDSKLREATLNHDEGN